MVRCVIVCVTLVVTVYVLVAVHTLSSVSSYVVWAGSAATFTRNLLGSTLRFTCCFVALMTIITIKLGSHFVWQREWDERKYELCHNLQATCTDTIKHYENMKIDITDRSHASFFHSYHRFVVELCKQRFECVSVDLKI